MAVELDHVFICTAVGAPGAERLRAFGLTEGSRNVHPGQGTANRRFFFGNAMLELLWVADEAEARSEQTRRVQIWEHWSGGCPFGVILRPAAGTSTAYPFVAWEYAPATMPGFSIRVAEGTGTGEPLWFFMESGRAPAEAPVERRQPLEHACGLREISGVRVVCGSPGPVTRAIAKAGVIEVESGAADLMEVTFDGNLAGLRADFRPDLPLVFRW